MMQNKLFLVGITTGLFVLVAFWFLWLPVGKMRIVSQSTQHTHDELLQLQDLAVRKARQDGRYKCCIEPPCTMCFWEGNKWNYNVAGTCACDEFIAKGEDPCPQCKGGVEEGKCGGKKLINWTMSVCNNFS